MDFSRTEEQELLIESAREWVARYLPEDVLVKAYEDHGFSDEVYKSYLDAGFGFMGLPEDLGGTLMRCSNISNSCRRNMQSIWRFPSILP